MGIFGIDDKELQGGVGLADILIKWGNLIQDEMRNVIANETSKNGTKQLEQSVLFLPLKIDGQAYTLEFQANDYFKYLDQGVRGAGGKRKSGKRKGESWRNKAPQSPFAFTTKKPPVNFSDTGGASLRQWSYNNGLNPYVVRELIFRQGIKPRNFMDQVLTTRFLDDMIDEIAQSTGRMVEISISEGFE